MYVSIARLRGRFSLAGVVLTLVLLLPLAGCGSNGGSAQCGASSSSLTGSRGTASTMSALRPLAAAHPLAAGSSARPARAQSPTPVTIGLTYVPNIQFAPFYVAQALGYYQAAGLTVTFHHHGASEDEFGAILAGREDVIFAGGDEVLQANSRGAKLVYMASIYTKYPVALMVPQSSPVHALSGLKGCTIGVPGKYGATYIGLLALLHSANLKQSDVNIQSIGFTQVSALLTHKVDAVMGYLNNEAIQFQSAHFPIRTFAASDVQPLISNGLAATQAELAAHPDVARAVIAATLRGLAYTLANPQQAVKLSEPFVPGLNDATQQASALAVLQATLPLWQTTGTQPGYNDPQAWQSMATFLQSQGQLGGSVSASASFSNAYLPQA
jgi:NitT/TauT family transport system substrate-binding protein